MKTPLDFLLVHGYILTEEGKIDDILLGRLEHAIELYRAGLAKQIISAGKFGKRDENYVKETGITESMKMSEYFAKQGVPPEKLLEEREGTSTWACTQNVYNGLILPNNWTSGMVLSNQEHLPRIMLQTSKIIPAEVTILYAGKPIRDPAVREDFIAHEKEGLIYTLNRED